MPPQILCHEWMLPSSKYDSIRDSTFLLPRNTLGSVAGLIMDMFKAPAVICKRFHSAWWRLYPSPTRLRIFSWAKWGAICWSRIWYHQSRVAQLQLQSARPGQILWRNGHYCRSWHLLFYRQLRLSLLLTRTRVALDMVFSVHWWTMVRSL